MASSLTTQTHNLSTIVKSITGRYDVVGKVRWKRTVYPRNSCSCHQTRSLAECFIVQHPVRRLQTHIFTTIPYATYRNCNRIFNLIAGLDFHPLLPNCPLCCEEPSRPAVSLTNGKLCIRYEGRESLLGEPKELARTACTSSSPLSGDTLRFHENNLSCISSILNRHAHGQFQLFEMSKSATVTLVHTSSALVIDLQHAACTHYSCIFIQI